MQLPLCPSSSSFPLTSDPAANTPCRSPAELCIADPQFSFSFSGPVRSFQSLSISIVDPPRLIGIPELCERPDQRSSPGQHEAARPRHVILAGPAHPAAHGRREPGRLPRPAPDHRGPRAPPSLYAVRTRCPGMCSTGRATRVARDGQGRRTPRGNYGR